MCELYGISFSTPGKAISALHSFADHSIRNPHGWGIAFYRGGEAFTQKGTEKAMTSKTYFRAVEDAESDVIISHIRKASRGEKHERNCHPFTYRMGGRDWVFAHNGHVDGIGIHPRAKGETDSETIFHMLMDSIRGREDVESGLQQGIISIFEEYEFGRQVRLNFLLTDGTSVYAFAHHPEKPIYYQNVYRKQGANAVVSTQLLDGTPWAKLPEDRLLVISRGQILSLSGLI